MNWNFLLGRANSRLYLLRTLKYYNLTIPDLVNIYISFVRPVLEYATPVWSGGLSKGQCQMIEQVQKRACRVILGAQYTGYDAALTQCGLRRLEERRSRLCLSFAKSLQLPSCQLNYLLPPVPCLICRAFSKLRNTDKLYWSFSVLLYSVKFTMCVQY